MRIAPPVVNHRSAAASILTYLFSSYPPFMALNGL